MITNIFKNKNHLVKILPQVSCLILFVLGISLLSINNPINKAHTDSVVKIEPIYAADFSNDKILMGASHNVFVGKVLEQIGTKERGIGPETQFTVEIVENIKGGLKGTVTVNQQGGYKDGVLYVIDPEGDTLKETKWESYLLQPGSTYLLATRYNEKENWYTLNSYPGAHEFISSKALDTEALKMFSLDDSRIEDLKEAYKNEILLDADIKNNKTFNNYESLKEKTLDEKQD